jgi:hypothetical protein
MMVLLPLGTRGLRRESVFYITETVKSVANPVEVAIAYFPDASD